MKHGETGGHKGRGKSRTGFVVLSFLLTFIFLSSIYYVVVKQQIAHEKTRYNYIAVNESDHIITTVDCIMARTNTLKALVQDHHGGTDFFDSVAADVYDAVLRETGVALKNLAIAPRGVVSHVYPYKGNEALVGFNYFDLDQSGNAEALHQRQFRGAGFGAYSAHLHEHGRSGRHRGGLGARPRRRGKRGALGKHPEE